MKGKTSPIFSGYIIDGVQKTVTPAKMLNDSLIPGKGGKKEPAFKYEEIVDESLDLSPSAFVYSAAKIQEYLKKTSAKVSQIRNFPLHFASQFTRSKVDEALIDVIWHDGKFKLDDLLLKVEWNWDEEPIGNMSAFYSSVEALTEYADALGVRLKSYRYGRSEEGCHLSVIADDLLREKELGDETEEAIFSIPYKSSHPRLGKQLRCPSEIQTDASDWLIYIPFDTCDYRLGGSILSELMKAHTEVAPDVLDPDYFIDCYEVVRELVEDGIIKAGITVGDGGLLTAVHMMASGKMGANVDISNVKKAYQEKDPVRILFGETPGVVFQISDDDYDYVDAELVLQDIAYFPVGHPVNGKGISVSDGDRSGVAGILESLLNSQTSEGED